MNRAVFLDRDGVLNQPVVREGRPFPPATVAELRLTDGVAADLTQLKAQGFLLIVVTNQPDVARGTTSRESVEEINTALRAALPLDDFYTCYHDDSDACDCRKPLPGLLLAAAAHHHIDLAASYLVGDRWRDIDAGAAAGCRTILIDCGYCERAPAHAPDHRASTLQQAVREILRDFHCFPKPSHG